MKPSDLPLNKPVVNLQVEQSFSAKSTEKQPPLSCKAGSHTIISTDQSLCTPRIKISSANSFDQARSLDARQGSYHGSISPPTYGLCSQISPDKESAHQDALEHFEKELMSLACITPSKYLRRYPPAGHTRQYMSRSPRTNEKFVVIHQQLRQYFEKELSSSEFLKYLNSLGIPENYNESSFSEAIKLEVSTRFIFRHHPTFQRLSFSDTYPHILLFPDVCIMHMYDLILERNSKRVGVEIFYSQNNKPVIQQKNARPENSAAAIAAMFAHERGKTVNLGQLCSGVAINLAGMIKELKCYGFDSLEIESRKPASFFQLSQTIKTHGPAAVLLKHDDDHFIWIIVDNIDAEYNVRCRNPYNCEELEVKLQAFFDQWLQEEGFVQIKMKSEG